MRPLLRIAGVSFGALLMFCAMGGMWTNAKYMVLVRVDRLSTVGFLFGLGVFVAGSWMFLCYIRSRRP
jgi:hypothetical protein